MSANPRKQDSLEQQDTGESILKATSAEDPSSPYDSTEFQALRSGPYYLQQNLGTEAVGLDAVLDNYNELEQDEDDEKYEHYNKELTAVLDDSEASGEAEDNTSKLQAYLPPTKNKYRVGVALSHQDLISRMRLSKGKKREIDRLVPEHIGEEHSGDNLLPDSGMSKMLEDDMRAQNVLLKALKEKLTANLDRLKADEAMLLHMFEMTDKDLENSQPLNKSDQGSKRQLSQHEEANEDTWKDISKKLKLTHENEDGGTAVQGQYVAHSLQEEPSFELISEDEDEDEEDPEEYEDEEAALKALNQMISEFADDESN